MTARTLPVQKLVDGMTQCVRDSILPALTDPSARTQAEVLIALLEGLPSAVSAETAAAVRADSSVARALASELGASAPSAPPAESTVAELLADNHALHALLAKLAGEARAAGDAARLASLQKYFLSSAQAEHAPTEQSTDFASLSSQEDSARRGS